LKKKILIVGGTGFIGFHLAKKCLKKHFIVTSLSSRKPKKKRFLKKVNYIECDISNKNNLKRNIKGNFDYVVNLGGYVNHNEKVKTFNSHYKGCKNLADFFKKKNIISFIQIGSSVEYGSIKSPQSETQNCSIKKLKSTYGKAKFLATKYLLGLFEKERFPVTILRLYLVYGPNQDPNRLISSVINSCLLKKKFPCSNGNQYRDFLYVDDLINAITSCFGNSNSIGKIINMGQGKPKKVKDIIKSISSKVGTGVPEYGKIKFRKDEIKTLYPDIKLAKKILKWKSKISLKKGIDLTIKNYKSELNLR
jgi:nucleoside-diphosphate-sugar epimerase